MPVPTRAYVGNTRLSDTAVGTTSVRALEAAAARIPEGGFSISSYEGETDLYILPGFEFKIVDMMVRIFIISFILLLRLER